MITAHEGQLLLAVFAPPSLHRVDQVQLVNFMQEILGEQGDLFAFKINAEGVTGSVMSAIVEYCDNDVSLRATSELNGKVVKVSRFWTQSRLELTLHRVSRFA